MWNKLFSIGPIWRAPKMAVATAAPKLSPVLDAGAQKKRSSREYVDQRYFFVTIALAAVLHAGGLYIWQLMPKTEVMDIPVRSLSITLNDEDPMSAQDMASIQPDNDNSNAVDSAILESIIDHNEVQQAKNAAEAIEKALSQSGSNAMDAPVEKLASDTDLVLPTEGKKEASPKQFIRKTNVQAPASPRGNSTEKEAELMSRYEQLISLWLQKFKKYPMQARKQNIQGETIVRIRIDRQGNIRYYILEYSTGSTILDRAAIDMVRRANPVPAVPDNYPESDLMEFLIPVSFELK